jgi:hypothetical protein
VTDDALIESIIAGQQPEPSSARAELERRLGPDELARIDERMLTLLTAEQGDPGLDEPPAPFFDALGLAKDRQRQALRATLTGRSATATEPLTDRVLSFDGGARQSPPIPVSHEETLAEIFAELPRGRF